MTQLGEGSTGCPEMPNSKRRDAVPEKALTSFSLLSL
jgi:hypothetical protein